MYDYNNKNKFFLFPIYFRHKHSYLKLFKTTQTNQQTHDELLNNSPLTSALHTKEIFVQ